jgi:hypothetical protein
MKIPSQSELNRIACGISEGYLKMVCSFADLTISEASRDADNLGIDYYLEKNLKKEINGNNVIFPDSNNFKIQLKSCYSENRLKELENSIKYNIDVAYFEKIENTFNAILVVLRLPPDKEFEKWLEIKKDYTKLNGCAYFKPVFYSDKSSWIEISKDNLLTPENLQKLFNKPNKPL